MWSGDHHSQEDLAKFWLQLWLIENAACMHATTAYSSQVWKFSVSG
jgi:hypothetical protein